MIKLLTASQAKEIDYIAENENFIPPLILMENATTNITTQIRSYFSENNLDIKDIVIFCGLGNNGGDGLCIARHLSVEYNVNVFVIGDINKASPATLANLNIIKSLQKNIDVNNPIDSLAEWDFIKNSIVDIIALDTETQDISSERLCIIDALIGTGFKPPLNPLQLSVIQTLNNINAIKIAIDIPSGLEADIGTLDHEFSTCFKADLTITITAPKVGMILHSKCCNPCGDISIARLDVGIQQKKRDSTQYSDNLLINNELENKTTASTKVFTENDEWQAIPAFLLEKSDITKILRPRPSHSHKHNYGKVLVIAGSESMPGAAALCANAAIKMGAGLVYLASTCFHNSVFPEIIRLPIKADEGYITKRHLEQIKPLLDSANAIVIGPGIGHTAETLEFVRDIVLSNLDKNWIIDADAISAFNTSDKLSYSVTLTPHSGEFLRLLNNASDKNYSSLELENNKIQILSTTAKQMGCNILLKDSVTVTTDGNVFYWNNFGNPGMATAGSGDVLAGIIGANIAKNSISSNKINMLEVVSISSTIHSLCGDFYAEHNDMETLTASELICNIKDVIRSVLAK